MVCDPIFIPGTEGCVLPTGIEQKAKLLTSIGLGNFYRSINASSEENNISVSNTWMVPDGLGGFIPYNDAVDTPCDVVSTTLVIFVNLIAVANINVSLNFSSSDPFCVLPPPVVGDNGITAMRSIINDNVPPHPDYPFPIVMPLEDIPSNWFSASPPAPGITVEAESLEELTITPLSGGTGLNLNPPLTPPGQIRTGPAFTLSHVTESDVSADPLNNGVLGSANSRTVYWNGMCWKPFDSVNQPTACDSDLTCP